MAECQRGDYEINVSHHGCLASCQLGPVETDMPECQHACEFAAACEARLHTINANNLRARPSPGIEARQKAVVAAEIQHSMRRLCEPGREVINQPPKPRQQSVAHE